MKVTTVKQSDLTGECLFVQVWGRESCKTCEAYRKKGCGGKQILKTGKNEKGKEVPLGRKLMETDQVKEG